MTDYIVIASTITFSSDLCRKIQQVCGRYPLRQSCLPNCLCIARNFSLSIGLTEASMNLAYPPHFRNDFQVIIGIAHCQLFTLQALLYGPHRRGEAPPPHTHKGLPVMYIIIQELKLNFMPF